MLDLHHQNTNPSTTTTRNTNSKTAVVLLKDNQQPSRLWWWPWRRSNNNNYNNMPKHKNSRMAVTLVDAGMVARLTDEEGSVFIGLLSCIGSGNGREAAHFALLFSNENSNKNGGGGVSDSAKAAFTNDMEVLFQQICRGYGTNVDTGEVLRGVLGMYVCLCEDECKRTGRDKIQSFSFDAVKISQRFAFGCCLFGANLLLLFLSFFPLRRFDSKVSCSY